MRLRSRLSWAGRQTEPGTRGFAVNAKTAKKASCLLLLVGGLLFVICFIVLEMSFPERSAVVFWTGMAVLLALGVAAFWLLHVSHVAEIRRFRAVPKTEADALLRQIGVESGTEEAGIALAVRAELAKLGKVPPESISASNRFYPDLENLPFYDSPDDLAYVLTMEEILGFPLPGDALELEYPIRLPSRVPDLTVGDMIEDVLQVHRRWKKSGEPPCP